MMAYRPRFTLRRALIAVGLMALFLGWLRPDRSKTNFHGSTRIVIFAPIWPKCRIIVGKQVAPFKAGYQTILMFNVVFD